ncbi:hypothetical protein [Bacterioplanoides pacificum]|uniref:Uncharacterized protein n=1 Tax=Bacterioplanoides pacificum TaxID=1171596 RepID=A0ABV7VU11_9GAMM
MAQRTALLTAAITSRNSTRRYYQNAVLKPWRFFRQPLGLLPQTDDNMRDLLPDGHQPLMHLLHLSQGGLLISLPAGALAGNNSCWQEVTLTRYYD